jgi:hypothetical protein
MQKGSQITKNDLRAILRLPNDANTALSFDQLGIDSWAFIEVQSRP